jgi:outer membrane protein insertion porin family
MLLFLTLTATGLGVSQPVRGETSETVLAKTEVIPTTSVVPVLPSISSDSSTQSSSGSELQFSLPITPEWQNSEGLWESQASLSDIQAVSLISPEKSPLETDLVKDSQANAPEATAQLSPESTTGEENLTIVAESSNNPVSQTSESQPAEAETPATPIETPTTPTPTETPVPESSETQPAEEARVLVAEVVVTGAEPQLENLVYNTIRTRPGRSATRSQLQEDVNAIYTTGYFANVKVIPEDTPLGVRVTYAVTPNPVLKEINIDTVPKREEAQVLPPQVVEETFREQYGKIINLRDLQEGITKINEWYSSNGYDLAQVVGSPQISENGTVTLVIAEGVIENIQVKFYDSEEEPVEGRTRDFIVTREMRLKPGDVFNRNTAQEDLQRVFGLGLFEDVRLSFEPASDPQEVIVNVDVVEGNTGSLAAGAGISSSSGIFGTLSYQQQNLGGNNQTLGSEIQIGERELLFDVSFTDPWIATDPFRTAYTVNGFRRRSISLVYDGVDSSIRTANGNDSPRVVRTGGGVTFLRPIAEDVFSQPEWILSAGFLYQNVRIENANGDTSPRSKPSDGFQKLAFSNGGVDDLWILSFIASQDQRDNPSEPTSGYLLRLGMEQTVPIGSGSILLNRIRANYSYYMPLKLLNFDFLKGPQTLAFNVQGGTAFGDLPPYEAFVIGGSNSVRGYAEGEAGSGRSYFQATAEYRFPIFSVVGGALFVDYGTTLGSQGAVPGKPGDVRGLPGSGLGYGIGVRIQSPVGPIRIDYGFNDSGGSRVHFGIGQRF